MFRSSSSLMSVESFCSAAGMSRSHLYKLAKACAAPRSIKSGGRRYIRKEDADSWLQEHGVSGLVTNRRPTDTDDYHIVTIIPAPPDCWVRYFAEDKDCFYSKPVCLALVETIHNGKTLTFVTGIDEAGEPVCASASMTELVRYGEGDPNLDPKMTNPPAPDLSDAVGAM
ncbi:MAG: hypothetical protein WCJ64_05310 [Rhodospirillaceae bacterium]